jgi:hypothetical protein
MERPKRPTMTSRQRTTHIVGGLVLMAVCIQVWAILQFLWVFQGGPGALERYDLRPYCFATAAAQLWFHRLLIWGWPLFALAGMVLLIVGIINRPVGRHRAWWLAGWGIAPVALFACMILCLDHGGLPGIRVGSVQGLGRLMHVGFPADTRLVVAVFEPGPDAFAWAVVTMPTADVLPFVREGLSGGAGASGSERREVELSWNKATSGFWYSPDVPEWHPETVEKPLTAHAAGGRHGLTVVADTGGGDEATVYLLR